MSTITAPTIEKRSIVREVRADIGDGETVRIIGYAAVWDEVSSVNGLFDEVIRRGAFRKSLAEGDDIAALFNHDENIPLGRTSAGTLTLTEDDIGLRYEIIVPPTQAARDLVESIKRGDVPGTSFGFRVRQPDGQLWTMHGDGTELRELTDVELLDVSPSTFPIYAGTDAAVRSRDAWRKQQTDTDERRAASHDNRNRRLRFAEVA